MRFIARHEAAKVGLAVAGPFRGNLREVDTTHFSGFTDRTLKSQTAISGLLGLFSTVVVLSVDDTD